jgi:hypothetical protein
MGIEDGRIIHLDLAAMAATGWTATDIVQQTAAHEMGHLMSGPEHLQTGNLMAFSVQKQALTPQAADVARWRSVRGL